MTTNAPSSIELSILGTRCRATGAPPAIEAWLRHCWQSTRPSRSDAAIEATFSTAPPWRSTPAYGDVEITALDGVTLSWLRHGARYWSTRNAGAGVELTLFGRRACIRVWDAGWIEPPRADRPTSTLLALHVAICEALRARGLVPLHAAVIARDGRATALVGHAGVGKSSTLIAAMEAGWAPIAEDFAWLDPVTRQVFGWSGERGVRLSPDGLRRLSSPWSSAAWREERDGKLLLAYNQIPVPLLECAQLTRVTLIDRDASTTTRLEPLSTRDAARALWESAGVPLCRISREEFARRVPTLLADLEWTRLALGREPSVL
jgi:hypothetical protein